MNLGAARKHAGLTQAEASAKSGIALGTLRRWEQGVNEPDMKSLALLASLYGVTTDTLIGTEFADKAIAKARPVPVAASLPYVGRIAAGSPREAVELDGERRWASPDVVGEHPNAFFLRASGDSMNLVLPDGCMVAIDPDECEVVSGRIYAVLVNGSDATIKQVFRIGTNLVLHPLSSNPEHRDRVVGVDDPDAPFFRVVGRAVWYVGEPL